MRDNKALLFTGPSALWFGLARLRPARVRKRDLALYWQVDARLSFKEERSIHFGQTVRKPKPNLIAKNKAKLARHAPFSRFACFILGYNL